MQKPKYSKREKYGTKINITIFNYYYKMKATRSCTLSKDTPNQSTLSTNILSNFKQVVNIFLNKAFQQKLVLYFLIMLIATKTVLVIFLQFVK